MNTPISYQISALERAKYLQETLTRVHASLVEQSKEHAEISILTGVATSMCLAHFSNLDRICQEVINGLEKAST